MVDNVGLPLTGIGDTTATIATENIGGVQYQRIKLIDGTSGSTVSGSAALIGQVGIGSTGSVSLSSGGLPIGLVGQSTVGSSANYFWTRNISSQVDIGSTGTVSLSSGTQTIGTVLNATTTNQIGSVALTSGTQTIGTVLNASSTAQLGSVSLLAGSSANILGSVALIAGSSDNALGQVVIDSGSTANIVGGVALLNGSSSNMLGTVALALGTSATYNFMQSIPFSSGNIFRTSIATSVDIQLIAANANRKSLIISNRSTSQTVGCGFSTAAVTTALANVDFFIGPSSYISFGLHGGLPLCLGPMRGINLTSTTVAGSVGIVEFT